MGVCLLLVVVILALGAGALQLAWDGSWLFAGALGACAIGCWLIMLIFVERVWLVLDRAAGTVELRRHGMARTKRAQYPLAALKAVELQSSLESDSGRTYRLALRLDGQRKPVPMTRYYQSGKSAQICVDAAQDWLTMPQPTAPLTGPLTGPPDSDRTLTPPAHQS